MKQLILGGARSGKSSFAEQQAQSLAQKNGFTLHYIATALSSDDEMTERIEHHQARRGVEWILHESPYQLCEKLPQFTPTDVVLIDCLTLWLNNQIFQLGENANSKTLTQCVDKLVKAIEQSQAHIILVSNEVGMGIVPLGEVSRLFVDHAGWMNQSIATLVDGVTFVAAGLPLKLKG